jgi:hypothetical protein
MSSNNQHLERGCPAFMDDPRQVGDWTWSRVRNQRLAADLGFNPMQFDSNAYREKLQQNATKIMQAERMKYEVQYHCPIPNVGKIPIEKPYYNSGK